MQSIGLDREALLAELERHGEEAVRLRLAHNIDSEERTALAVEWLRRREQERAHLSAACEDAFRAEQARVSERAAMAAERQVVTAERANRIALAALLFVAASFLLSLGTLLRRRR